MIKLINTLFQKIDQFVFIQLDNLKSTTTFIKAAEPLALIDDEQRNILNQTATIFLIFVPVIIISYLFLSNWSLKREIAHKQQVISLAHETLDKQRQISDVSRTFISRSSISSKTGLEQSIKSSATSAGINLGNINLVGYEKSNFGKDFFKVDATMTFAKTSTQQLTQLLGSLTMMLKAKISSLKVNKDANKSFINGSIGFIIHGQEAKIKEEDE